MWLGHVSRRKLNAPSFIVYRRPPDLSSGPVSIPSRFEKEIGHGKALSERARQGPSFRPLARYLDRRSNAGRTNISEFGAYDTHLFLDRFRRIFVAPDHSKHYERMMGVNDAGSDSVSFRSHEAWRLCRFLGTSRTSQIGGESGIQPLQSPPMSGPESACTGLCPGIVAFKPGLSMGEKYSRQPPTSPGS